MFRILADNTNAPFAADDYAILTNFLNTGSDFHIQIKLKIKQTEEEDAPLENK
jgi:hypothetical protein